MVGDLILTQILNVRGSLFRLFPTYRRKTIRMENCWVNCYGSIHNLHFKTVT